MRNNSFDSVPISLNSSPPTPTACNTSVSPQTRTAQPVISFFDLDFVPNGQTEPAPIFLSEIASLSSVAPLSQSNSTSSYSSLAYKKVANRVRPVPATLPEEFRIVRRSHPNPLQNLPILPTNPPDFTPGTRLTQERLNELNLNPFNFLWPE